MDYDNIYYRQQLLSQRGSMNPYDLGSVGKFANILSTAYECSNPYKQENVFDKDKLEKQIEEVKNNLILLLL